MEFNDKLKTIKIRELFVASIITIILVMILPDIFPIIDSEENLWFALFFFIFLLFFIWKLRDTNGFTSNIKNVFEKSTQKEILYVFLLNFFFTLLTIIIAYSISVGDSDTVVASVTPLAILLEIIATVILGPAVEELIFRGVLLNRLKIRIGVIPAILISSILFGLGHESVGMVSAFIFGVCMCILYLKTDNILTTISLHMLNNFVVIILDLVNIDSLMFEYTWFAIIAIISLIATVLLVIYMYKGLKEVRYLKD